MACREEFLSLRVPGLLQIQIAFEIAQHLIVDAALAAKLEERSPLHPEQFMRQRPVLAVVRGRRRRGVVGRSNKIALSWSR